ncbi:MAG TPA: glucan biosynthesis protein G [Xanthobacteraceae bacterium]
MNRRSFILAASAPLFAEAVARAPIGALAQAAPAANTGSPFNAGTVRQLARDLAQHDFKAPTDSDLPDNLKHLTYDQYRSIRFLPERALWKDDHVRFQAQFFHRGFYYTSRVEMFQVVDGRANPIRYSPSLFNFGQVAPPPPDAALGFAGFRLHAPINRADYYDEVCVFLGASYFRAVAKGQIYGLSARGLSINTADPKGEEFPSFKAFWLEKPAPNADSIVVHALLDSPSVAGAYRFTIRPGDATIFDTEVALYPRRDVAKAGFAPTTSMFFFDFNDRQTVDDYRPAVHDSDGLAIRNGRGEDIWRPLNNPRDLQISIFADTNPRGFGLLQRQRDFRTYQDLESRYDKRPSLWIEPIGDWGEGAVQLVEIPTKEEIHDNIVAFWQPKDGLKQKGEYSFTYRLHWGAEKPGMPPLARIFKTRIGAGPDNSRLFVLDLVGDKLKGAKVDAAKANLTADKGKISNIVIQSNPETGGWRLSFRLAAGKESVIELRGQVMDGDMPLSEVWVYRWTA